MFGSRIGGDKVTLQDGTLHGRGEEGEARHMNSEAQPTQGNSSPPLRLNRDKSMHASNSTRLNCTSFFYNCWLIAQTKDSSDFS